MRFDGKTQALAALLALALAIGCGVIAGLLGGGRFTGRYAVPVQGSETTAPPPSSPLPPTPIIVPPAAPPIVASPPPPPEEEADAQQDDDSDRIADAIGRATQKALDRGEPVRWHKKGQGGYVVVSDVQYYPGRSCRTVYATIVGEGGTETRSAPHLWCQTDEDEDGDWVSVR